MTPPEILTLRAGAVELDIWPELGGSWVAFRYGGTHLSQPLVPTWAEERNPSKLAGFACGPWFNRIPEGRFPFEGKEQVVPVDRPDLKAATHGFIRHREPAVAARDDASITFIDDYDDPRSPYRYRSTLSCSVDAGGITSRLTMENTGPRMPFAVGFHPFFRRTEGLRLTVAADGFLENDETVLPGKWRDMESRRSLLTGAPRLDLIGLNNSFTGWRQPARLAWSDLGLQAALTAESSQPLLLHLFAPPDREILCLEPVTNAADVIHRRAFAKYGDMVGLDAGQRISLSMRIAIGPLGET
jgi:aldose 1-epimerase